MLPIIFANYIIHQFLEYFEDFRGDLEYSRTSKMEFFWTHYFRKKTPS